MALAHPRISPDIFSLGPIHATWYGMMYVVGFLLGYWLGLRRVRGKPNWKSEEVGDLLTYLMLAVILGGRIGYVLFYGLSFWAQDFLYPLKINQGGMSFHGGLIGVVLACMLFARKKGKTTLEVGDFITPLVPIGLFFGRIGNFINGELWGRVTELPWGMIFTNAPDARPRHPSMLYEAFLEGIVLFLVLRRYSSRPRRCGRVTGMFLTGYGVFRFLVECVRAPDEQIGFVAFGWLTMGQLLCLPMLLFGVWLLLRKAAR